MQLPVYDTSDLKAFDSELPIRGFAVKYVHAGTEHYTVSGRAFPVGQGHYLLANATHSCHAGIHSATPVQGLCIDLGHDLLRATAQAHTDPELFTESDGTDHFTGPAFLENRYSAQCTAAGVLLRQMADLLFHAPSPAPPLSMTVFHALATAIVEDHAPIVGALQRVRAVRNGTRKDIFRRVQRAKAYMDACYDQAIDLGTVAREAAMSEFHFIRAFRMVQGITPHRYLLARRIDAAHELMVRERASVSEAAYRTGFADAASFSKAFKRTMGFAPSLLLGRSRRN